MDLDGNSSAASGQGAGTVSADPLLPRLAFSAPTPASLSSVSGTVTLQTDATPPSTTSSVSYGFDPAGFRRSRTVATQTTRFLLGGLIETTTSGTITGFDVDGPAGDLAHYTTAPTSAVNPSYSYYSGHGDLAAETDQTGTRTRLLRLDPWGQPLAAPGGSDLQELFTGRWDKKHDQTSGLIEMGVRPYDPALGRFLTVDAVDGGALNEYDYALQDPLNQYDLDGKCVIGRKLCQKLRKVKRVVDFGREVGNQAAKRGASVAATFARGATSSPKNATKAAVGVVTIAGAGAVFFVVTAESAACYAASAGLATLVCLKIQASGYLLAGTGAALGGALLYNVYSAGTRPERRSGR